MHVFIEGIYFLPFLTRDITEICKMLVNILQFSLNDKQPMVDVTTYLLHQLDVLRFGPKTMMCLPGHLFFPHPFFFCYVFLR